MRDPNLPMGKQLSEEEPPFDFQEQSKERLMRMAKYLAKSVVDPELPQELCLDADRALGHIAFEMAMKKNNSIPTLL